MITLLFMKVLVVDDNRSFVLNSINPHGEIISSERLQPSLTCMFYAELAILISTRPCLSGRTTVLYLAVFQIIP